MDYENKQNLLIPMQQIIQQPITPPLDIRIRLVKPSRIPRIAEYWYIRFREEIFYRSIKRQCASVDGKTKKMQPHI